VAATHDPIHDMPGIDLQNSVDEGMQPFTEYKLFLLEIS
jgi:hypothetical protein